MEPAEAPQPPPSPARGEKPKIVYVMGRGGSGSTILGITLGNCEGVFFAGELGVWLMGSGKPLLGDEERTRFWQGVVADVEGASELFGEDVFRHFERALAAFRIDSWFVRRRMRASFLRVSEGLYRSIASRAGAEFVVDTSHLPLRARELQRMEGIDLHLLFLVRDGEGVVASLMRGHVEEDEGPLARRWRLLATSARLWGTYLQSIAVFLRQPRDRRLLVRHEDFIARPEAVLREILDAVGSPAPIPDLTALSTGIPLRHNRLAKEKVVALKHSPPAPASRSRFARLIDRPWALVLALLRPAATGRGG